MNNLGNKLKDPFLTQVIHGLQYYWLRNGRFFWNVIRDTNFQCGECEVVQSFQKDSSSYKIFISDNINKLNICYVLTNTLGISDIELHNIEFLMYKTTWEWLSFTPWSENSRKLYFTLNMVHVCVFSYKFKL